MFQPVIAAHAVRGNLVQHSPWRDQHSTTTINHYHYYYYSTATTTSSGSCIFAIKLAHFSKKRNET